MSEQTANGISKGVGGLISGAFGGLLTWLNTGSSGIGPGLVALAAVLSSIGGVVFSHIYRRYLGVLAAGGNRKGSPSRDAYDALRSSLETGNIAARLYASRLIAFLDWVDRFFHDHNMANQTLFPHAFGLKASAPLWTAPALDRCLLFALIYPVATIFVIWVVSGHIGPAEAALGLTPNLSPWRRGLAAVLLSITIFAGARFAREMSWMSLIWYLVIFFGSVAFGLASSFAGRYALVFIVFFVALVGVGGLTGKTTGSFVVGLTFFGPLAATCGVSIPDIAQSLGGVTSAVVGIALTIFFGVCAFAVYWINNKSRAHRWHGLFLSIFLLTMVLGCLSAASFLPLSRTWTWFGPFLLFLPFLTSLNAPFNWISLGLTRALLRRGIELQGWWPYLLAVVDAVLAAVIIVILALTMIVGVQAFDGLAVHGGGEPVLPLPNLLDGIILDPAAPEYWWLYALLLSTMIPSLVNLAIGGASLLRGVPGLPTLLLRFMPESKAVAAFERHWIALILTLQVFLGAFLGILAQTFLAVVVIVYIMPPFGFGLLDMAREVAGFNLPLRIGQAFASFF